MDFEYEKNEKFRELCYVGDIELIKSFYNKNKPDINSQNKVNGWTALHWASKKNDYNLVNYLLESGAKQNIKNNENKEAAWYAKDQSLRDILSLDGVKVEKNFEENQQKTDILIPNFIKNPSFHYADKNLFASLDSSSEQDTKTNQNLRSSNDKINNSIEFDSNTIKSNNESSIITIRVKSNFDEDFVEIDIDKNNTDFNSFKELCIKELDHIESISNFKLKKIRKLPNILIRNTNDIRRLKNEQEIEIVFS